MGHSDIIARQLYRETNPHVNVAAVAPVTAMVLRGMWNCLAVAPSAQDLILDVMAFHPPSPPNYLLEKKPDGTLELRFITHSGRSPLVSTLRTSKEVTNNTISIHAYSVKNPPENFWAQNCRVIAPEKGLSSIFRSCLHDQRFGPSALPAHRRAYAEQIRPGLLIEPVKKNSKGSDMEWRRECVILFFHGNSTDAAGSIPMVANLVHNQGCRVFVAEYSGYGPNVSDKVVDLEPQPWSVGTPTWSTNNASAPFYRCEESIHLDAWAALCFLVENLKVPMNRIIVMGHSLGCFAASALTADVERLRQSHSAFRIGGLVLLAPFVSALEVVKHYGGTEPQVADVRKAITSAEPLNIADRISRVGDQVPTLILHGEDDDVVTAGHSVALVESLAAEGLGPHPSVIKCVTLPGLGHNDFSFESDTRETLEVEMLVLRAVFTWI